MRDPFSEALFYAVVAGCAFLLAFPLGPWMFYMSGLFAVAAAGFLAYGLGRKP